MGEGKDEEEDENDGMVGDFEIWRSSKVMWGFGNRRFCWTISSERELIVRS